MARPHVLAGGIAGCIVEAQIQKARGGELLDKVELADPGRRFGSRANTVKIVVEPQPELPRLAGIGKDEHRRALHVVVDHTHGDAAGFTSDAHSPVVAGHQRAFGGGHGHIELAHRVLTVDLDRAGDAQRNLAHADEVFDVAAQRVRIDAKARRVGQCSAGLLSEKRAPAGSRFSRVIIVFIAGDTRHCLGLGPEIVAGSAT